MDNKDIRILEHLKKIPWTNIKGMRNIVAHEYGVLDEELVWETATEDIHMLLKFCSKDIEKHC